MTVIANMQLHCAGDIHCLAGFNTAEASVYVLRKQTATEYELHRVPISEVSQSLRAILAASERADEKLRHFGRNSVLRDLRAPLLT